MKLEKNQMKGFRSIDQMKFLLTEMNIKFWSGN